MGPDVKGIPASLQHIRLNTPGRKLEWPCPLTQFTAVLQARG